MKNTSHTSSSGGSNAAYGTSRNAMRPRPVSVADKRVASQEIKIGERLSANVDLSNVDQVDLESVVRAMEAIASLSTRMPLLSFRVARSSDNTYYIITASGVNVTINGPETARALNKDNNRFLAIYDWEFNSGAGTLTAFSMMQRVIADPGPREWAKPHDIGDDNDDETRGGRRKRGRVIIEGDYDPAFE
jgi:hypothetical protein